MLAKIRRLVPLVLIGLVAVAASAADKAAAPPAGGNVEARLKAGGIENPALLAAFRKVPHDLYLTGDKVDELALARSIDALGLMGDKKGKVLEIGTSHGYRTALLAEMAQQVYSLDKPQPESRRARILLAAQGYSNVEAKLEEGVEGWKDKAPFDAIILSTNMDPLPASLTDQLAPGGRLVMPSADGAIVVVGKDAAGKIEKKLIAPPAK